ncbi:mannitol dehydrogenase family protein [Herbaspirillum rhizosphaerae]|uniref:mannitol dehydrogenase family protein n=1 Tax=Herbaspirillum rhizosphaerae TaxID=346179 RepID=UPI0009FAF9DA|nr:mannitol dehydrogenase family protein [Herbaspirillum rhizosphaerae]
MMKLNKQTLEQAGKQAALPTYDRAALLPGIVHLGLGAFHRAHQAVYTDTVLAEGDLRWGIVGVSLRSPDTRDALAPQDNLYTLGIRGVEGEQLHVIGSIIDTLVAPESPATVLAAMSHPHCHIVSLTVTEKGYCHDPASNNLRFDHPYIAHDLAHANAPRSAIGFIVRALEKRRDAGLSPFTVLSCDNLPSNGNTSRGLVLAFAERIDPELSKWISQHGAFPNSMVDRIVPKTTEENRAAIAARLTVDDAWPVVTEPFSQWVIEDRFAGPRPAWELAGATMVEEAEPYEHAKLRMLNGSHSSLAYLGALAGYVTVDQAIRDDGLRSFIERMMTEEIAPTLQRPGLDEYLDELVARFRNPALKHRLQQIAMDGSQKLPQRLLGTIRARLDAGLPCERLCFAVAGWMRYLRAQDEAGQAYPISDPLAESLQAAASIADVSRRVDALLAIDAVFGNDLAMRIEFVSVVKGFLRRIEEEGVLQALSKIRGR